MKINISETAGKKYYNEFYWILLNYDSIIENPKTRVHFATTRPLVYAILSIVNIVVFSISFAINNHLINLYPLIFFSLVLIVSVIYLLYVNNIINKYHDLKGKRSLQIAKYFIQVNNENGKYRLLWRDTKHVVFNHYTICFIPKDPTKILISTRIEYKKEIKKAIRMYSKRRLVIDNTGLYPDKKTATTAEKTIEKATNKTEKTKEKATNKAEIIKEKAVNKTVKSQEVVKKKSTNKANKKPTKKSAKKTTNNKKNK